MTAFHYFSLFVIYAFMGWCMEVILCSVDTGRFVNRGFLNGPYCPIYGFGMLIIITALTPIEDNLILLFAGSMVLCSALELVTGRGLKTLFHATWWDYSQKPFNFHGYICLQTSLAWGAGGVFMMRIIHPIILKQVDFIPLKPGIFLLGVIYILMAVDLIATVLTILNLNKDLERMNKIAALMQESSDALAEKIGNRAIRSSRRLEPKMEEIQANLAKLRAEIDAHRKSRRRIFTAYPGLRHYKLNEYLQQLKEELKDELKKERPEK